MVVGGALGTDRVGMVGLVGAIFEIVEFNGECWVFKFIVCGGLSKPKSTISNFFEHKCLCCAITLGLILSVYVGCMNFLDRGGVLSEPTW